MRPPERPRARAEGLVVKSLPDELLIYHLRRHQAHSLNRIAAAVWRQCDGTQTPGEIALRLHDAQGVPVDEDTVRYALGKLSRAGLLLEPVADRGLTRRALIQRLGTAAAVALPLVTSIVSPSAAQAQSCVGEAAACTADSQCCGGACASFCCCACVLGTCGFV